MSTGTNQGWHLIGAEEVQRTWGWFLALGIVLVLLGVMALGWSVLTTLVSVVIFGWFLLLGGILCVVHAFVRRCWGGFFLELFAGILYAVFVCFPRSPGRGRIEGITGFGYCSTA